MKKKKEEEKVHSILPFICFIYLESIRASITETIFTFLPGPFAVQGKELFPSVGLVNPTIYRKCLSFNMKLYPLHGTTVFTAFYVFYVTDMTEQPRCSGSVSVTFSHQIW